MTEETGKRIAERAGQIVRDEGISLDWPVGAFSIARRELHYPALPDP